MTRLTQWEAEFSEGGDGPTGEELLPSMQLLFALLSAPAQLPSLAATAMQVQRWKSCDSRLEGFRVGDRSRGPFRDARRFPST